MRPRNTGGNQLSQSRVIGPGGPGLPQKFPDACSFLAWFSVGDACRTTCRIGHGYHASGTWSGFVTQRFRGMEEICCPGRSISVLKMGAAVSQDAHLGERLAL